MRLGGTACWRVRVDRMRAGSVVRVGLLTAALRPGEPRPARRRTGRSHCAGLSVLFRSKRPHPGPSRRPANPSPPAFTARVIRRIAGRKRQRRAMKVYGALKVYVAVYVAVNEGLRRRTRRRRAMKVYDAGCGVRGVGAPSGLMSAAAWFAAQAIASPVPRVHRLQMCVLGGGAGGICRGSACIGRSARVLSSHGAQIEKHMRVCMHVWGGGGVRVGWGWGWEHTQAKTGTTGPPATRSFLVSPRTANR